MLYDLTPSSAAAATCYLNARTRRELHKYSLTLELHQTLPFFLSLSLLLSHPLPSPQPSLSCILSGTNNPPPHPTQHLRPGARRRPFRKCITKNRLCAGSTRILRVIPETLLISTRAKCFCKFLHSDEDVMQFVADVHSHFASVTTIVRFLLLILAQTLNIIKE